MNNTFIQNGVWEIVEIYCSINDSGEKAVILGNINEFFSAIDKGLKVDLDFTHNAVMGFSTDDDGNYRPVGFFVIDPDRAKPTEILLHEMTSGSLYCACCGEHKGDLYEYLDYLESCIDQDFEPAK